MKQILIQLIQSEKRRMILRSVGAAIIIAGLVLAIAFVITPPEPSDPQNNDDNDSDNNQFPPDSDDNYVLSLNAEIDTKFVNDNIDGIYLHGNATSSVYDGLLDSYILPYNDNDEWNVTARIVDDVVNNPGDIRTEQFNFSSTEIYHVHTSFLQSLNNTVEVNRTELPDEPGSIPNLLFYNIFYDDGTGLTFTWLGFQEVDILEVQNITWTGTPSDFSRQETGDSHYLSPLSAFDSFLNELRELYETYLD